MSHHAGMYAVLAAMMHALISVIAAVTLAPYALDPAANTETMGTLSITSALISTIGLVATAAYLSRQLRPVSGVIIGIACGALCSGIQGMLTQGKDFSLVLYLAILAPTLLAVLMASLLDRPKSGWQT